MTLEQKVGQIVFVDVTADCLPERDGRLQNWIRLVKDYGVGGIVSYGGTPRDLAALVNRLQKVAQIPVLFASDFEGGSGQQVRGATEFPANMALAAIGSEDLMYRAATVAALEGRAMGIRLTYSPVVDISTQPENPSESVRSLGGDVELLAKLVHSYVRAYREQGMLTAAKHFPGGGNVRRYRMRRNS
jgi:beta-N-acetylhexosaminidase